MNYTDFEKLITTTNRPVLFYDIETRNAEEGILRDIFQDEEVALPKHPGEFDPYRVKYGNIKDEKKKREKLQQVMEAHAQEVANWEADCARARLEAWEKFVDKAALSSLTGRVIAVGYGCLGMTDPGEPKLFLDIELKDEGALLKRFWHLIASVGARYGKIVSFNGHAFDLPFCRRRAWVYDLKPPNLVTKYNKYEDWCYDVLEDYKRGGKWGDSISLDRLAQLLGVRRKSKGIKGAEFQHYVSSKKPGDLELALDYLAGDILSLFEVVRKINS